jgi:NAD-dependent deacetylase
MHGALFQSRCVHCNQPRPDKALYETAADLPKCPDCGASIRPHIVWFGEVPLDMEGIYQELDHATVLLVVGTSGSVYPAAGFVYVAKQRGTHTIYVGPEEPLNSDTFDEILLGSATDVLPRLLSSDRPRT